MWETQRLLVHDFMSQLWPLEAIWGVNSWMNDLSVSPPCKNAFQIQTNKSYKKQNCSHLQHYLFKVSAIPGTGNQQHFHTSAESAVELQSAVLPQPEGGYSVSDRTSKCSK